MNLLVLKDLKGLAVVLLLSMVGQVSATSLFNVGHGFPDIQSQDLNVDYNAGSGDFNIFSDSPFTFGNYVDSAGTSNTYFGTFLLDFSVDGAGTLDNAGSFSIVNSTSFLSGPLIGTGLGATLLSGFVTDFGFSNTTFEVLLNITSGLFEPEFGLDAGVIVSGDFTGFSLASNYINSTAQSDTFKVQPVPEPSILVLFAIAGLSFFRVGRQQQG